MQLCDYLVAYLESNFVAKDSSGATEGAANGTSEVTPLDGMKVFKRDDVEFAALGGTKKRGKKKGGGNAAKRDVITHGVDTIDSFAMLEIVPPSSVSGVQTAIDQLKAKKEAFSKMERGQVESISSKMRNEKKKADGAGTDKKKAKTVFSLEQDFPDLAVEETKKEEVA